ncbi:protein kinase [bacterium]|nr:protein kinase [bacterium]
MKEIICPECGTIQEEKSDTICSICKSTILVNEKYKFLKILGKNSAITYLAQDLTTDNSVIIKELSLRYIEQWKSEELFQREINILKQLHHPNIPSFIETFSAGIGQNKKLYLVQKFVVGTPLDKEFEQKRYTEKEILELMIEIFSVLDYLHKLQPPVIHRDIKLSNLIRMVNGEIALIDFGSVKDLTPVKNGATISGTFGFMAPEIFRGDAFTQSDYYSVGVVATVLFSRKLPEDMIGNSLTLDWKPYIGKISQQTGVILETLLHENPQNRPQTPLQAISMIQNAIDALDKNQSYDSLKYPNPKNMINQPLNEEPKNVFIAQKPSSDFESAFYDLYTKIINKFEADKGWNEYYKWKKSIDTTVGFALIGIVAFVWYQFNWYIGLGATIGFFAFFMAITGPFYKKRANRYVDGFLIDMGWKNFENRELFLASLKYYFNNNIFNDHDLKKAFLERIDILSNLKTIDSNLVNVYLEDFERTDKGKELLINRSSFEDIDKK